VKKNRLDATQVRMWQIYIGNLRARKISEISNREREKHKKLTEKIEKSQKFKKLQKQAANIRKEIRRLGKLVKRCKNLQIDTEWDSDTHCSLPYIKVNPDWDYDTKLRDKVEQLFNAAMKALAEKDAVRLEQIVKQMEEL